MRCPVLAHVNHPAPAGKSMGVCMFGSNRSTAALCLGLALAGCGSRSESEQRPSDLDIQVAAEAWVRNKLKDPDSAKFSNVRISRKSGHPVACGSVNSRNGFGGMSGAQRFISGGSSATFLEEEMADGDMEQVWARFC